MQHRTSRLTAVSSSRKRRFEVAATKASRIPASFLTSPAATATNSDTMRPPARGGCGGRGFGGRSDGGDRGAGASAGEAMAVAATAGVAGEAGRPGAVVVAAGEGRARHEGREQGDRGAAQARRRLHHQGQGGPALHQEHGRRVVRLRREERLRPGLCSLPRS
uniref:Uncharacterized protein n=1 Tax=Triticum urartu TaxID=4572 RepID=A0A8R7PAU0_TRIUA